MSGKKIITTICSFVLVVTMSFNVFAASTEKSNKETTNISSSALQDNSDVQNKPKKSKLTDEQKDEMKAKIKATKNKWDALNDAQKQEIYDLKKKQIDLENQIIDRYIKLGLIDKETESIMKERIIEHFNNMKKDGRMPMIGGRPCMHKGK